jgi:hypothetical protein
MTRPTITETLIAAVPQQTVQTWPKYNELWLVRVITRARSMESRARDPSTRSAPTNAHITCELTARSTASFSREWICTKADRTFRHFVGRRDWRKSPTRVVIWFASWKLAPPEQGKGGPPITAAAPRGRRSCREIRLRPVSAPILFRHPTPTKYRRKERP